MRNRNIITKGDVLQSDDSLRTGVIREKAMTERIAQPAADDYLDRLMKYVPVEIVGIYTIIEVNLKSLIIDANLGTWLLGLLIFGLIATFFYVRFYLKIVRWVQVLLTDLGFAVWVFTIGGWFDTLDFWKAEWGIIATVIYLLITKIVKLEPMAVTS